MSTRTTAFLLFLATGLPGAEPRVARLSDFETEADLRAWEVSSGEPRLVPEGATHGERALEIRFDPAGRYHPAYLTWRRVRRDWSGFDALVLDVLNPTGRPVPASVLIADEAWAAKGRTYWNRHNGTRTLPPGRTRWTIPVEGLYRGEAGSRNGDIPRPIDADSIVRLDFGFGARGAAGRIVIDDLRLERGSRPAGVRAFDFGPAGQSTRPGWVAVSDRSAWSAAAGFGWGPRGGHPWPGAARDTSFGPALLRDFCQAGGYRFRVAVPAGRYRVTLFFENSGYWGGEQAKFRLRRVLSAGEELWREERPDGPAHALWRFEEVEPVGVDLWDTYLAPELARPVRFEAEAGAEGLELRFESDGAWGAKVSALALCPLGDEEAARWVEEEIGALAAEFRSLAVDLDPPPERRPVPAAWRGRPIVAWGLPLSEDFSPRSLPPPDTPGPAKLALERLVVRGESEALPLALRALEPAFSLRAEFRWREGSEGIPVELLRAWFETRRRANTIAYRVRARSLRPADSFDMDAGVSRELLLRLTIPPSARPGVREGDLFLDDAKGRRRLSVPVRVRVSRVVLDRRTDFGMGFFGLLPPDLVPARQRDRILDRTLEILRHSGMNRVSGGPSWRLVGWRGGEPKIDFRAADRFYARLREHGFTGRLCGYGGARFRGLHDGYQRGASAERVERESGLDYETAFRRAWGALARHAREARWPTIEYAMCDETRVREVAERELAFMRLMAGVTREFPAVVRASGSYSVTFERRPRGPEDLLGWHQKFFETLDISSLNLHDDSVLREAKRLGKEVQIYNQGRTRYSFGLYSWNEHRRGVSARTEWHLNVLHGYQFFDLDGREPDSGVIRYGRSGIWRTIDLERCREGAEDFYLYGTLARALEGARGRSAATEPLERAARLLDSLGEGFELNRREPPERYDPEALKRRAIEAIETLGGG